MMRRILLLGLVLAVVAGIATTFRSVLSLDTTWPLLMGAAVAMVPLASLTGRMVAFVTGIGGAWIAFLLAAAVLPDIPIGKGIAIAVGVFSVTLVVAGTRGRIPLWAALAGMAAYTGLYEAPFIADPTAFLAESFAAATTLLLAAAVGVIAVELVGLVTPITDEGRVPERMPPRRREIVLDEPSEISLIDEPIAGKDM